jgi:hypothetical protein
MGDNVKKWAKIAETDNNVIEALSLFGSLELNWVILYKIFEIVENDIKKRIFKTGWVSREEEDRFKREAQPHRHAKNSKKLSNWMQHKRPMTFFEARTFVETLLENWLRSKIFLRG